VIIAMRRQLQMHAIGRAQASGEELRYKEAFSTDSLGSNAMQ
jgi:hypothetical protein